MLRPAGLSFSEFPPNAPILRVAKGLKLLFSRRAGCSGGCLEIEPTTVASFSLYIAVDASWLAMRPMKRSGRRVEPPLLAPMSVSADSAIPTGLGSSAGSPVTIHPGIMHGGAHALSGGRVAPGDDLQAVGDSDSRRSSTRGWDASPCWL